MVKMNLLTDNSGLQVCSINDDVTLTYTVHTHTRFSDSFCWISYRNVNVGSDKATAHKSNFNEVNFGSWT